MTAINKIFKFTHSTGINVYEVEVANLFADENLSDKTEIEMSIENFKNEDDFDASMFFGCSVKAPLAIYADGRIDDGHHRFMLYNKLGIKKCLAYFFEDYE